MSKKRLSYRQIEAIQFIKKNERVRVFNSYLHYSTTKALERMKIIRITNGYATLTKLGKTFKHPSA